MPTVDSSIILLFLIVLTTGITMFVIGKIGEAKKQDASVIVRYQAVALLVIYIFTLLVITVIGRKARGDGLIFLIPFSDFYLIIKNGYPWYYDNLIVLNLVNAALFIPVGFLSREIMRGKKLIPVIFGLVLSAVIEVVQLITDRGVFDVNDIIWNTFGTIIGCGIYALYKALWRRISNRDKQEKSH